VLQMHSQRFEWQIGQLPAHYPLRFFRSNHCCLGARQLWS
jgi:hypothetical protein